MKIIVRSPNWIGDCVMCLPALRALKKTCEHDDIVVVTQPFLRDVFLNIPEISRIWALPGATGVRGFIKQARDLRQLQADAGILFTNSFHSALLFALARVPRVTGYNRDLRGFLLERKLPFPRNDHHHIHFYLDLITGFTGEAIPEVPPIALAILDEERESVRQRLEAFGVESQRPLLGISPSAAYGTAKQWEPDAFANVITRLAETRPGLQILLFGARNERAKISDIATLSGNFCVNLAGELSLRESIVGISLCRCFLGNDSGLLHIAAGVGVPYVGIFGPTIPHKTAPVAERSRVLYKKADCAPCKHRDCPIDHRCMNAVTVDEVFEAVTAFL